MNESPSHEAYDLEELVFQLQADLDFTKHLGGQAATERLVDLCRIDASKYVLDVGCGVEITPCNIAKSHGCKVLGVDLRESMIARAEDRAVREGVQDRVAFRVADMHNLPFEGNHFDAVMGESVFAFVGDKSRAVNECVRVTKPGGIFGITEATWIETPPSELADSLSRIFGTGFAVLDEEGWRALLDGSGLEDVVATSRGITVGGEAVNRFRRVGLKQIAIIWFRALALALRREYRGVVREALADPRELIEYWGYGVYVGRKLSAGRRLSPASVPTWGASHCSA